MHVTTCFHTCKLYLINLSYRKNISTSTQCPKIGPKLAYSPAKVDKNASELELCALPSDAHRRCTAETVFLKVENEDLHTLINIFLRF